MTWIMAFTLTQVIEITVGMLFWKDEKVSSIRKIATLFGASLITHPMVWFVFPEIRDEGGYSHGEYFLWPSPMPMVLKHCIIMPFALNVRFCSPCLPTHAVFNGCFFV